MTKFTTTLTASAIALVAGSVGASAQSQQVIDGIVASLTAQGFSRIEIDIERGGLDVDAYGPGIEGDFYYTRSGRLVSSDIDADYGDDPSRARDVAYGREEAGSGYDYEDDEDGYDDDYDDDWEGDRSGDDYDDDGYDDDGGWDGDDGDYDDDYDDD